MMHPNAAKLNASRIPVFTHYTTLEQEGQRKLADIIKTHKYRDPDRESNRSYYFESGTTAAQKRKAIDATGLFAKELRLSGNDVCYCTVPVFIREMNASVLPRAVEPLNPVMSHIGKGYIVMPEFRGLDSLRDDWPLRDLYEFESILTDHLNRGGAFVFCGPARSASPATEFGQAFHAALDRAVVTIKVGAV